MGMRSYVDYSDLSIRPGKEKEFDELAESIKKIEDLTETMTRDESGAVELNEVFNDWKIISYWYKETLDLLEKMNKVLTGEINLLFETGEERAIIRFGDTEQEEAFINLGMMEYNEYKVSEFKKQLEEERTEVKQ
jgi:hypothetical protein